MRMGQPTQYTTRIVFAAALVVLCTNSYANPLPQSPPNIGVNGYLSVDKAQRGHRVEAAVVMDIPSGFHVNANRPLEKFLIATQLQIEAPPGVRVGPVLYPRAVLRNLKFSKSRVSVYEGRAIMYFNVTVPANFGPVSTELKARVRYQSCNDDFCFPPQTRDLTLPITVVGANESVKRINGQYFGGARRKGTGE
jgi:DsbC/DsbD-like thiol-disulfide interchange protein